MALEIISVNGLEHQAIVLFTAQLGIAREWCKPTGPDQTIVGSVRLHRGYLWGNPQE